MPVDYMFLLVMLILVILASIWARRRHQNLRRRQREIVERIRERQDPDAKG